MTAPLRPTPLFAIMRVLLVAGAVFVFAAGVQLYVLSGHTDRFFAWTIRNPLTAASIGAFYLGAVIIAGWSSRQRWWAMGRVGVPGVLALVWLTLLATLRHLDELHLHGHGLVPTAAAWGWLAIYALDAPLLLIAFTWQLFHRRVDPPRSAPMPAWYRGTCLILGVLIALAGGYLFFHVDAAFVWQVPEIAAQTLGAWLIALGLLLGGVAYEGDWVRVRPATGGLVVLGVLELIALARYPHVAVGAAGTAWISLWAVVSGLGGYGLWRVGHQLRR